MNIDFSPVLLLVGNLVKKSPAPVAITYAQAALCAAHDEGLVTKSEANSISKQFGLGLMWEE